jgi:hypothetical protein
MASIRVHVVACCLASCTLACGSDSDDDPGAPSNDAGVEAAYTSEIYSDPFHWICLPGKDGDLCRENLDATVLNADGTTSAEPHVFATDPEIDCFYVYPTISTDQTPNADLTADRAEIEVTREQAARYSSVCNVYAPVYRQVTLAALFNSLGPEAGAPDRELAYADVLDAWKHYLANYNRGRPFILTGHSQGAGILRRLVAEEIENDDALRGRLVSALLIGGGLAVPEGADVGQDFQKVPVCHAPSETGCAVSFSTFLATEPPPANSFFGKPRTGPGAAVCANPAALGGGPATLKPYFTASTGLVVLLDTPSVSTPFVTLPDFARGECVVKDGFSYLEITLLSTPADQRPQDVAGRISPEWGLHLIDVHLAMGDLVELARSQAEAFAP